ncbi:flagellar hook-associated protein 3 [Listeria costaricensis]|uniref:flagellar hook-associated protein 3 n=1 Tax=Listeria costaricensis TaxID=2026604 RepID=UPI000C06BDA7|nr:flagellar hook-associated protein 3 [Listeria costaricensis]
MRISTNQQTNTIIQQLNNASVELAKYQTQVSSGKKYEKISDNPSATAQILSYNHVLSQLNREKSDVDEAQSLLTSADTALSGMNKTMMRINNLLLQAVNGTNDEKNLKQTAQEIKGLLDSMISLANTDDDGRYIFSGSNTTVKPFVVDQSTGELTYQGTTTPKNFQVTDTHEVEVYHNGDVFTEMFRNIQDIVKTMEAGDIDTLRNLQGKHTENVNIVTDLMATVGGHKTAITSYNDLLANRVIDYTERRANVEEVDMPKAVSDLNRSTMAFQAALQSSIMVQKLSILNYM